MNDTFDQASRSLNRLMEVAGGSANAYDEVPTPKPTPATNKPGWDEVVSTLAKHFHSETSSPAPGEESPISSDEPSPEEMRSFWNEFHTLTTESETAPLLPEAEEEPLASCATDLEPLDTVIPNPALALARLPRPISPEYRYAGVVENAGELFGLYNDFSDVLSGRAPTPTKLDSGLYSITLTGNEFVLDDPVKGFRYQSDRTKALSPTTDDVFVWVFQINGSHLDKIGYLQNGYVFIRR